MKRAERENRRRGPRLKCVAPVKITHATVAATTTPSSLASCPTALMGRYSSPTAATQQRMATTVPGPAVSAIRTWPSSGRGSATSRAIQTCANHGHRNAAYCAKPTHPEAMESGALKESCQM